ncbi:MAG TPA: tripartite tricarboxylate transporter permease [Dongiaceae bacterium]
MSQVADLMHGLSIAMQPGNLLYTFIGVFIGTMISHLPGIGPSAGMALLIPITYGMQPATALMMLTGIYYGCMYGGAVTAILLNTPGDAAAVMTTLDGYPLARMGRAGAALSIAAMSSFVAGTLGVTALIAVATPLANFALRFGPPEFFALMFFALSTVSALAGDSISKGLMATFIGLAIATIGIDLQSGISRFTFGIEKLDDKIGFVVVVVGLFALAGAGTMIESHSSNVKQLVKVTGRIWFTMADFKRAFPAMIRGWLIGFTCGAAPGLGGSIATMLSYVTEKKLSKRPEEFGKGAIEGVAGPEAAANADTCGALIHLLALGVPATGASAILMGAFVMYGITPGPLIFQTNPDVVWGLIASMYVGNAMLLILNLPLVGILAKILYVPSGILLVMILGIASAGIYSLNSNVIDLFMAWGFGIIGFVFQKCNVPKVPMLFGVILGENVEQSFRQAMTLSDGSPVIFVTSPISASLLALAAASILVSLWLRRKSKRYLQAAA